MKKKSDWLALSLILVGVILLMIKMGILNIGWNTLWPLFVLVPGIILEVSFLFNREIPGILVPGGVLSVIGLTFFICAIFGWHLMSYLWPLMPFGVAFGLFQLYVFGGREKELLIPVGIIGGVAIIALCSTLMTALVGGFIPIILILVGGYLYFMNRRNSDSEQL